MTLISPYIPLNKGKLTLLSFLGAQILQRFENVLRPNRASALQRIPPFRGGYQSWGRYRFNLCHFDTVAQTLLDSHLCHRILWGCQDSMCLALRSTSSWCPWTHYIQNCCHCGACGSPPAVRCPQWHSLILLQQRTTCPCFSQDCLLDKYQSLQWA